jgi:hypothetical protein
MPVSPIPRAAFTKRLEGKNQSFAVWGTRWWKKRNGLAVGGTVTHATGTAEREASEKLLAAKIRQTGKPATVGEDKAYDAADHGAALRKL